LNDIDCMLTTLERVREENCGHASLFS